MGVGCSTECSAFGRKEKLGMEAQQRRKQRALLAASPADSSNGGGTGVIILGLAVMMLGGLHYGYNIAVVGAALPTLRSSMPELRSLESGTLSSATLLGAVAGSPLSGLVCSRYGRRVGTIIGESCSIIGAVGCAFSVAVPWMAAFRVLVPPALVVESHTSEVPTRGARASYCVAPLARKRQLSCADSHRQVGLGVGFCTLAKPLYVRETVPAKQVAAVQASFAPAVATGILLAQEAQVDIVPVAHNAGYFWPKEGCTIYPGECVLLLVAA